MHIFVSFQMLDTDIYILSSLFLELISHGHSNTCNAFFKVKSVCGTTYGTPLKTYTDNQSKAKCVVACSQDASCYSSVYDGVTKVCQIFPDYHTVGQCATQEYYSGVLQVRHDIALKIISKS